MSYRSDEEVVEVIRGMLGDRSQADLAAATGIDPTALNKVFKGTRRLALGELVAIADQLGVDPQELLLDRSADAIVFRADADQVVLGAVQETCSRVIDNYLTLESLAGRRRDV